MKKTIKRLLATIMAAVLLLSITACGNGQSDSGSADQSSETNSVGGDTGSGSDGTSEESSNETEAAGEQTDITLVLDWTPNTNHTGIYVAQEKGYFEEAGLNVTVVQPPDGGAEQIVASGDAQFGIGFQDTMAPALTSNEPLPISAIAAVLQHNTSGLVSLEEKGIDSFGKMTGHSYATWDSPTEQAILKKLVEDDGGKWKDVELISTYVEDIVAGLNSDIDSVWIYSGWDGVKLEMEGISTHFLPFKDADSVFDYYNPVVIGNDSYMNEHPDVVKAFTEALKKGYEFAAENPDESADILLAAAPELDENLVRRSQAYLSKEYVSDATSWGVIDSARWNAFYSWLNANKLVEKELPADAGLWPEHL